MAEKNLFASRTFWTLIISIIILSGILYLIFCRPDYNGQSEVIVVEEEEENISSDLELSLNQIIFRVKPELNNPLLENLITNILTEIKAVESVDRCACGDSTLRLVTFDEPFENAGELLTALGEVETKTGGGMTGEPQFILENFEDIAPISESILPSNQELSDFISNSPAQTVIAILDSGLDVSEGFESSFLYANPEILPAQPTYSSGFNFVENNFDIQDNIGLHGTYVTKIIYEELITNSQYQILPLKVANENGEVRYWDLICAVSFIDEIRSSVPIKVVNTSLGFEFQPNYLQQSLGAFEDAEVINELTTYLKNMGLLRGYIENMKNDVAFIVAAGNDGQDIDNSNSDYLPAEMNNANILSVGGYEVLPNGEINRHDLSNFGLTSVDLAAPMIFKDLGSSNLIGTSFSTALCSAKFADFQSQQSAPSMESKINAFLSSLDEIPELNLEFKNGRLLGQ